MPDGMDYALVERTVLDGLGKIFDTTPGSPDTGSYVTEATLLAWIKGKTLVPGYLYNGVWYSDSGHTTPVTGEAGSLYVELEENVLYRWDGEAFNPMSDAQLREDILDGTVTAKKAECDASGNTISTTYATKAEVEALRQKAFALQKQIDNITEAEDLLSDVEYKNGETAVPANVSENAEVSVLKGVGRVKNGLAYPMTDSTKYNFVNSTGSMTDGVATFTASAFRGGWGQSTSFKTLPSMGGRTVLIALDIKTTTATTDVRLYAYGGYATKNIVASTAWQTVAMLVNVSASWPEYDRVNNRLRVEDTRQSGWDAIQTKNLVICDLTVYFSGTIPTGLDIATIQTNYPELLEPSDYGTEVVFPTYSAVKSQGRNLWNEQAEAGTISSSTGADVVNASRMRSVGYIEIPPTTLYFYNGSTTRIELFFYDADKNFCGYDDINYGSTFTPPSGARFMRFSTYTVYGSTYKGDICINKSDSQNGTYTPYMTDTLTFPSPVSLKSAGAVAEEYYPCVEVNGEYKSKKTNPLGIMTFNGTENWQKSGSSGAFYLTLNNITFPYKWASDVSAFLPPYVFLGTANQSSELLSDKDKALGLYCVPSNPPNTVREIWVKDTTYADADAWKAHLTSNPLTLYYELATPADPTYGDPILDPFIEVEPYGTIKPVQSQSPKVDGAMTVTYVNKVSA